MGSPISGLIAEAVLQRLGRLVLVYSSPYSECPSAYVGQTGRQFATRMMNIKVLSGDRTRNPFWPYIASQPVTRLIGQGLRSWKWDNEKKSGVH